MAKILGKVRKTNTSVVDIKDGVYILQEDIADDPPRFQERGQRIFMYPRGKEHRPLPPPARPAIQSVEPGETGPRLKVEGETVKLRELNVNVGASEPIVSHGTD